MAGKVSDQLILVLIVAASAALAIPALLVPVPPLFDYANHLVRLWLIAGGAHGPPLAQMYAPAWEQAFTNVGIDYIGAVLGWIVPATAVGTGMLVFATALPPLGALLLNRALFGGLHWSQVAILFFAWNATLIAGFLNFHIGIGLALAGAALEPRLGTSSMALRASVRAAIGFLLIVVHAFGLLYYCALITGLSIGRSLGPLADLEGLAARAGRALAAAAAAALPSFLVIVLAPALPGAHTDAVGKAPLWDFSLASKSYVLLSPIATYHLAVDVAFALAALTPLAAAALAGRCEAHAGLLILAAAMTLIALLAPAAVAGTWWIDNRFPLMAVLALLAGLRPNAPLRQRTTAALAVLLTFIVVLRTGWIAAVWLERQQDV
ncbi:MAG TPA: hypothetical protein VNK52_09220, partial [Hyphomicrobiaceae bacterium]|nr:hypothetical protein [Hyphomicrobiaceae bacterium]